MSLSTSTSVLSEVTYSFLCIRRTNNFYRPLCWAQGVQGSFSCRIQKVNLDNCVYSHVTDSRAVKTTAKASSSITTEGSLDKPKFLSPWSEARKRLSLLLWKLQKVESMYKVLPIIVFKSYIHKLVRVSKHLQSQFTTKEINRWEKSLHEQKNKSTTLRDKAA